MPMCLPNIRLMTDSLAYDYVKLVLEREFPATHQRFSNAGLLHFELTNIIEICAPLLYGLDEKDPFLNYEVIGITAVYLQELEQDIKTW